ncbi:MAG TPA: 16S rRNA (cytosine(967)-C(5))-methyltransferase [Succinivibrionaceae bacterium]|nr:16S rRNA (cytosine(967)-C(5))-methyltransferase [Succinivibrionaceae bacterium]
MRLILPDLVRRNSRERVLTATVLHLKKNTSVKLTKKNPHYAIKRNAPVGIKKQTATGSATRAAAAMAVAAVENGKSLTKTLPFYLQNMDARDRALVQEIVYGTLRHRRLLSERLKDLLDHSITKRFENSRALLLCALYQIVFTRIPSHAVVASTVGACQLCKCKNMTGMVNAVLRRFLREKAEINKEGKTPEILYSTPDWLYKNLEKKYPADLEKILKNQNEHAPLWIRVESSKISVDEYITILKNKGIEYQRSDKADDALMLLTPVSTDELPLFNQGLVSVQDVSAQMAAPLLEPKTGEKILDACCAPGGKSAQLMNLCPDIQLFCADCDAERLMSAQKNFQRLKRNPKCIICDFTSDNDLTLLGNDYDKILLDAPCSGTGVIRRHPDIKWLRRAKDIDILTATQSTMLDHALALLKPNGILVYSTCSILKEENEEQVKSFLKRHSNVELLPFDDHGTMTGFKQLLPGDDGGDGFFYARFIKKS